MSGRRRPRVRVSEIELENQIVIVMVRRKASVRVSVHRQWRGRGRSSGSVSAIVNAMVTVIDFVWVRHWRILPQHRVQLVSSHASVRQVGGMECWMRVHCEVEEMRRRTRIRSMMVAVGQWNGVLASWKMRIEDRHQ